MGKQESVLFISFLLMVGDDGIVEDSVFSIGVLKYVVVKDVMDVVFFVLIVRL